MSSNSSRASTFSSQLLGVEVQLAAVEATHISVLSRIRPHILTHAGEQPTCPTTMTLCKIRTRNSMFTLSSVKQTANAH